MVRLGTSYELLIHSQNTTRTDIPPILLWFTIQYVTQWSSKICWLLWL